MRQYKLFDNSTTEEIGDALNKYAGDKYWEDRPFKKDSERIKEKFEKLIIRKSQ